MGDTFEGEIVMSDSQVGGCGWLGMGHRAAGIGMTHYFDALRDCLTEATDGQMVLALPRSAATRRDISGSANNN